MTTTLEIKRSALKLAAEDTPVVYVKHFTFEDAQAFVKELHALESDGTLDTIFVYVSSYGGEIFPLLMMIEAIHNSKKNIHVIGLGCVYSAGADIVATGPKGNRWIGANSYMHIHHAQGFLAGSVEELEQEVGNIRQLEDHLTKMVVDRSHLTMKKFKDLLKEHNGEWRLTAKEALEYGFVDRIGIPTIKKYEVWEYEA